FRPAGTDSARVHSQQGVRNTGEGVGRLRCRSFRARRFQWLTPKSIRHADDLDRRKPFDVARSGPRVLERNQGNAPFVIGKGAPSRSYTTKTPSPIAVLNSSAQENTAL